MVKRGKRGGWRGGGTKNPKPQACVGETRGAQEGVGRGGVGAEALPTSEAASLGARAAEVWPCAPAQLSLSRCRLRGEGGGGWGG